MSVLARDLDAYQRALMAYQQRAGRYNRAGEQYDASIMKDPNGNPYVFGASSIPFQYLKQFSGPFYTADKETGKLSAATAPAGYAGMTQLPDNPQFSLLRQNPTGTQKKILTDVTKVGDTFYVLGPVDNDGNPTMEPIDASKIRVLEQKAGVEQRDSDGGITTTPATYTIEYDEPVFQEKPGEWTETFDKKAPDPTRAQLQQAVRPSLAAQEAGLLGEAIRGGGLKAGGGGLISGKMREVKPTDADRRNK
jgi:hypothetical protein